VRPDRWGRRRYPISTIAPALFSVRGKRSEAAAAQEAAVVDIVAHIGKEVGGGKESLISVRQSA